MAALMAIIGVGMMVANLFARSFGLSCVMTAWAFLTILAYLIEWRWLGPGRPFLELDTWLRSRPTCMVIWLFIWLMDLGVLANTWPPSP